MSFRIRSELAAGELFKYSPDHEEIFVAGELVPEGEFYQDRYAEPQWWRLSHPTFPDDQVYVLDQLSLF